MRLFIIIVQVISDILPMSLRIRGGMKGIQGAGKIGSMRRWQSIQPWFGCGSFLVQMSMRNTGKYEK